MRVLIVGGGSAGWIAASRLDAALNPGGRRRIEIAVLEAPDIGRIGVGEATIPTIHGFLRAIGLDEDTFLRSCEATFKLGIRFDEWNAPGGRFWHPFHRLQGAEFDRAGIDWLHSDGAIPFADLVSPQPRLAEAGRVPRAEDAGPYAYHMDAERFAEFLAARAAARGVERIAAKVVAVETGGAGIGAVIAADGRRHAADLYVDCTGFRRILIGALGARFADWSRWLLCDRAVTMQVPRREAAGPVRPFTISRAAPAGWIWDIGLQRRRGRGYVYAAEFVEDSEAEACLRASVPGLAGEVPVRKLDFQVGQLDRHWIGNCVAIGLSAGFVEPLESTGLHLADFAAEMLVEHFPFRMPAPALARRFNRLMTEAFDETLDFINLHYILSSRRDSAFWQAATAPARVAPRVGDLLERWEARPPSRYDFTSATQLWSHQNHEFILFGMGWRPAAVAGRPRAALRPNARVEEALARGLETQAPDQGW